MAEHRFFWLAASRFAQSCTCRHLLGKTHTQIIAYYKIGFVPIGLYTYKSRVAQLFHFIQSRHVNTDPFGPNSSTSIFSFARHKGDSVWNFINRACSKMREGMTLQSDEGPTNFTLEPSL
jgi:hypothetical protein